MQLKAFFVVAISLVVARPVAELGRSFHNSVHLNDILVMPPNSLTTHAVAALEQRDFEGDRLLQISKDSAESSYDVKRDFEGDRLLQISKDSAESSYDVKRDFEGDRLLQISKDSAESSYDI
jgi:hypothetical protein